MAVYVRKDSPFYWVLLERRQRRCLRESTGIPKDASAPAQAKELHRQAAAFYLRRMGELAQEDAADPRRRAVSAVRRISAPTKRSPDGWCHIYIVQHGQLVKIGRAVDVSKRLRTLRTASGWPLELLATIPGHAVIEEGIHHHFRHLRERGEWFRLTAELEKFIDQVKAGSNPIALLWDAPAEN